jgi:membrane associated rhomboid family serine protease
VIPLHDDNPTRRQPVMTIALIIACVGVYFVIQPTPFASTLADARFDLRHAAIPVELLHHAPLTACQFAARNCGRGGAATAYAPGKHVYVAIVTSMFLHGSVLHLLGNLLFLWVFGNNVEDRLGRIRYLVFYLAAGIVATVGYTLANPSSATPLLGASGAIAGVMGAYLIWYPRARVLTLISIIPLRVPAWIVLVGWFVLQFFTGPNSSVAWMAHVAGFVFGILVGLVLRQQGPPHSTRPLSAWPPPG